MVQDNKTFYIEKDTNYALQVECATNINFDDIKRIAKFFVMQLPEAVQNKIYNDLDRGVNIIDSEPQLNMYLHSFGNMHQAKMRQAFSNIGNDWFGNKEIEIIDYGCGQALATMLYHDYLQKEGIRQTVSKITLIEPSKKALCRAGLHAKAFYPEAEIHTINKLLNDVAPTEISHSGKPVLHLFSNILDIEAVDLHHLATLAQAENNEVNTLWVCVSPFFGNHKDNRIPCFLDILNQPKTYTFQRSKGNWQNQWTINCIIAEQKPEEILSTKVTFGDKAYGIRDEYGCIYSQDGKRLLKGNKDITSYTVKEGTKVICDDAFSWCESLQSIVIPESVTEIGSYVFSGCSSLQSIDIPDSVTEIGDRTFNGCSSLESIVIPDSVTEINKDAFCRCDSLQSIVIPDSVTSIGSNAFYECKSLQSIVIPDSVTEIGYSTFSGCSSLQSIVIPESTTKIGKNAFENCRSLQSIVIPDSVTEIGYSTFIGCSSLQSIVIPNSVTEIGSKPFPLGINLTSHSDRFVVENNLLIDLEEKRLIQCLKDREHIVIPDSVTSIGERAFSSCKSLQSIVIPDSVTEIGESAFRWCESLQSIVIPDSVTKIDEYAFGWSSLQSIVIPEAVSEIGYSTFSGCSSLQSIVIPESTTVIGDNAFYDCKSLQSIVIPNSVKSIGYSAFNGCSSLQSIVIPDSVTKIGNTAFTFCSSLQSIVIPDSVTEIGYSTFSGCSSLQSIVIPDSVTEIGGWAFSRCSSLQSIVIPESTTKIGCCAFPLGIDLTSHSNRFVVEDDLLIDLEEKRLIQCLKNKKHTVIPESVTKIGEWAFDECKSLQSIVIPDSVTEIDDRAFDECKSLQSIVIPDSVTEIGWNAFDECKSLQSIVIPKGKKKYFEKLLDEYYHKFIKEIDYKKIYNGLGFCYEFGFGYKRNVAKAEEYYAKAKQLDNKENDDDLPF